MPCCKRNILSILINIPVYVFHKSSGPDKLPENFKDQITFLFLNFQPPPPLPAQDQDFRPPVEIYDPWFRAQLKPCVAPVQCRELASLRMIMPFNFWHKAAEIWKGLWVLIIHEVKKNIKTLNSIRAKLKKKKCKYINTALNGLHQKMKGL